MTAYSVTSLVTLPILVQCHIKQLGHQIKLDPLVVCDYHAAYKFDVAHGLQTHFLVFPKTISCKENPGILCADCVPTQPNPPYFIQIQ